MCAAYCADLVDIRRAQERIDPFIHTTPVFTCRSIDQVAGRQVWLKCESFQRGGSFKLRGALNAVHQLPEEQAAKGVVTHSSGNFAQALAIAAAARDIPATVVMPADAPEVKKAAVKGYGARVVECVPTLEAREATAAKVIAETGGTFVHPYDHPHVVAGQGTVALELLEQVPDPGTVIVPVGGGGLVSGIALAFQEMWPSTMVIAAEPVGADDAFRSRAAGRLIPQTDPRTVADGLRTSLGQHTWPVVRDVVADVWTVDDAAIMSAMRLLWERAKLVIEPSGAVGLAALLTHRHRLPMKGTVAVVLSGGNVDLERIDWTTGA